MPRTHYETLGVKKTATQDEIRTAYRRLVLKHHPDRSKDPRSTELFIQVTQAYEVLSDPTRRRSYDSLQSMEMEQARQEQVRTAQYGGGVSPGYPPPKSKSETRASAVTLDVTRLTMLFSRAQFNEAELLARKIINADARQPIPYAVLGDIARSRGNIEEAAKMYALAVQMQPENALYHKRYEELLRSDSSLFAGARTQDLTSSQLFAPLVGAAMVLLGCFYLAVSHELPFLKDLALISTWTLGLVVTLFLGGVAIGASLATAGLLDRLQTLTTNALGRPAPTMTLGFVAAVSFWAAALLYGFLGASQRSFNLSTTRLVTCVAAATALLSASAAANGIIDGVQVLIWGGNLVYLGSLCGWTVADSFRR
jgi:curved DNA-binding protein CbpA